LFLYVIGGILLVGVILLILGSVGCKVGDRRDHW